MSSAVSSDRFSFQERSYQFRALAFGLSLAPRVFTRCIQAALTPLLSKDQGVKILPYLDDRLVGAPTEQQARSDTHNLLVHTYALGLTVNIDKSSLKQCWPLFPWVETRRYCHPSGI